MRPAPSRPCEFDCLALTTKAILLGLPIATLSAPLNAADHFAIFSMSDTSSATFSD